MSSNVFNSSPFLQTSREFPEDLPRLSVQLNKTYTEIAQAVNNRTISSFATLKPVITGEKWYIRGNTTQDALKKVYTFTSTANIPHGVNVSEIDTFIAASASYTDGTNWYGIPWSTNIPVAGQLSFYVTNTNIVFSVGAGAPAVTSGILILQWLSQS